MDSITCGFIGLGLIGGSIAKALRRVYEERAVIIAYDTDTASLAQAAEDGIVNKIANTASSPLFAECRILFLCAPVSSNSTLLNELPQVLSPDCILTDVGSVKSDIHDTIHSLGLDARFIGGHPMAGSEKSGYCHSNDRLIENAYYILTPTEQTTPEQLDLLRSVVASLGALPMVLSPKQHDFVTAAVSHLPHIISASLVNLVHDNDDSEEIMKQIAAGGFKDITRISSSAPQMWQQISFLNRDNVIQLLDQYMQSLAQIREELADTDTQAIYDLFDHARNYRNSFTDQSSGPIKKIYRIYVDIPDEPGVIATIATLLALHSISLKNIGIVHNREFEEGVLRIEFYAQDAMENAGKLLLQKGYMVTE